MTTFETNPELQYLDNQCRSCALGGNVLSPCPVRETQIRFNRTLKKNEIANRLMEHLIDNDGDCQVKLAIEERIQADNLNFPENLMDIQKSELLQEILGKATIDQIQAFLKSL